MLLVIFWVLSFCVSTALSIVLLGDRSLISGNMANLENIFRLVLSWKFIVSMALAVLARLSFIMINNSMLKIPRLAPASTTITTFATLLSLVFVVVVNYYFLNEKLNLQQAIGAFIILLGIAIMVR